MRAESEALLCSNVCAKRRRLWRTGALLVRQARLRWNMGGGALLAACLSCNAAKEPAHLPADCWSLRRTMAESHSMQEWSGNRRAWECQGSDAAWRLRVDVAWSCALYVPVAGRHQQRKLPCGGGMGERWRGAAVSLEEGYYC